MEQDEQVNEHDYDYNEIHNAEEEEIPPKYPIRRILSYVVLLATMGIMLLVVIFTIMGEGAMNAINNPRFLSLPAVLAVAYIGLTLKSNRKTFLKGELIEIISEIPDNEIPIQSIVQKFLAKHPTKDDKLLEKELTDRIIDLLWEGKLPNLKYIIDKKILVRVEITNPSPQEDNPY